MNNNKAYLYTSDTSVTQSKLYKLGDTATITNGKVTNQIKGKKGK